MSDSRGRPWRRLPTQTQAFFFLILGLMIWLTWRVIEEFTIFIITGVFLAVIALPIDKFWERLFPNRVAALFTMTTLLVIVTLPLLAISLSMAHDVSELAGNLQEKNLDQWVNKTVANGFTKGIAHVAYPGQNDTALRLSLRQAANDGRDQLIHWLTQLGKDLVTSIPSIIVATTIILFVVYYILVDGERLVAWLRRSTPLPARQMDYILRETRSGLNAVFMGQILTCIIIGLLGGIGFAIAGLPNPVLWGAAMFLLSLLPVIGSFAVWGTAGILLLVQGNIFGGIFMLGYGAIVLTFLTENIIKPKLIGRQAEIHPMLILLGVLGGVSVFGFIGLFLGPLLVGVTLSMLNVFEADYLDPDVNLVEELESDLGGGNDPDTAP